MKERLSDGIQAINWIFPTKCKKIYFVSPSHLSLEGVPRNFAEAISTLMSHRFEK